MNFLGHTTSWSDYDIQLQLSRWHSQGLWNEGFNLGDAFSKSLSILSLNVDVLRFIRWNIILSHFPRANFVPNVIPNKHSEKVKSNDKGQGKS